MDYVALFLDPHFIVITYPSYESDRFLCFFKYRSEERIFSSILHVGYVVWQRCILGRSANSLMVFAWTV